jgi:hypothetical protein
MIDAYVHAATELAENTKLIFQNVIVVLSVLNAFQSNAP